MTLPLPPTMTADQPALSLPLRPLVRTEPSVKMPLTKPNTGISTPPHHLAVQGSLNKKQLLFRGSGCVTWQTCLPCDAADMSVLSHSIHVCCVPKQTCLLCDTADMSAVCHSRNVCCARQHTSTAPEALNRRIRILSLQCIIPRTPLDRFDV